MTTLYEALSPLDSIEFICPLHNIPTVGLCVDYSCSHAQFYCMKCVQDSSSCIQRDGHELVTLSELLYRFFIKQETKVIDIYEITSLIDSIKELDQKEIIDSINDFLSKSTEKLNSIKNEINYSIESSVQKLVIENRTKISEMRTSLEKNNKEADKDLVSLLKINLPDFLIDHENSKVDINTIKIEAEKIKKQNLQNKLINDIKYLSSTENLSKNIEKIDNLLYIDCITQKQMEQKFSNKIDNILNDIEKKIDTALDDLEKLIIIPKENTLLLNSRNQKQKFNNDPKTLLFKKDITEKAHKANSIDGVFCAFKSLKGDCLVVWGTQSFAIDFYDLSQEKNIYTIMNAHTSTIFTCRHYTDRKSKRDLIITSSYDRSVKVWNMSNNYQNILTIGNAHNGYYIYTVNLLIDEKENNIFVISSASNEFSKVWDFTGKYLRNFGSSNESTYFTEVFHDVKGGTYYILNANSMDVKAYVFKTGQLYKSYKGLPQTWHMTASVTEINSVLTLIESDGNGNIRLWDFHEGTLLKTIQSGGILNLRGLCIWNDQYVFSSGSDYQIKLFDIKNGTYVKGFSGHTSTVCSVTKIEHPLYGECLISHGLDGRLKLWTTEKNK